MIAIMNTIIFIIRISIIIMVISIIITVMIVITMFHEPLSLLPMLQRCCGDRDAISFLSPRLEV